MVTTFVCLAGSRTQEVWKFLEKASQRRHWLAELEHPSLKKMFSFSAGRVSIYVHPSFYRSIKVRMLEECPVMVELPMNSAPAP